METSNLRSLDLLLKNTGDMCLKRRARLLISELNPQKKDKILDAGCGDGYYLYLLCNLGRFNLTGLDSLKENIENAKKQIGKKGIKYLVGDILDLPFKKESFDKIILSEVLEHVKDDGRALLELKRVLKKGGSIYMTVPHLNYPFFWDPINYFLQRVFRTHVKSGFWAGVWNMHDRLYTVTQLKKVIKKAGFDIERLDCLTHFGLPFNHYLTNIGFRIRTSDAVPENLKKTMTKFAGNGKKTWFSRILDFINKLDRRNDRKFSEKISTVGIFVKLKKT